MIDETFIKSLRREWLEKPVKVVKLKGGITNELYLVEDEEGRKYKVRIPGKKTELFIDREAEIKNLKALEATEITPKLYEHKEDTQISIIEFISGKVAKKEDFKDPKVRWKAVNAIKLIHNSNVQLCNIFNIFREVERYNSLLKPYGKAILSDYPVDEMVKTVKNIEVEARKDEPIKLAPCHNDLLPENFIFVNDKVYIIDWEYAGMNDPCFDIADFIAELDNLTSDEEEHIKQLYFGDGKAREKRRVDLYKLPSRLWWGLWAVMQYHVSELDFDFNSYARFQFNECLKHFEMLKEKYPEVTSKNLF
ncbi:phosphotransferase [Candidatus Bathyarchaeota archaeon]|nr:phosphotransferase [Candidatus Bathyarchaeota archaeon]